MKKILSILMIVLVMNFSSASAIEALPQSMDKCENLPDLAVKSIQIQEDENNATIKIKVKNHGRARVDGFWYYINYGDSTGEFLYFEGRVRPNQSQILTLTHTYENPGSFNAMVSLDPTNTIEESDETNNIEEFIVEIEESLADLAVKRIRVRERGNEATIKIRVKNYGTEDVDGFWYYINYGDSTGEFLYFEETLKANRTKTITLTHEYATAGTYAGMVNLDPLFMVPELDEENNTKDFFVAINHNTVITKTNALSQI